MVDDSCRWTSYNRINIAAVAAESYASVPFSDIIEFPRDGCGTLQYWVRCSPRGWRKWGRRAAVPDSVALGRPTGRRVLSTTLHQGATSPPEDWMNNALTNCSSTGNRASSAATTKGQFNLLSPVTAELTGAFRTWPLARHASILPCRARLGALVHCIMNMTTSWSRKLLSYERTSAWVPCQPVCGQHSAAFCDGRRR